MAVLSRMESGWPTETPNQSAGDIKFCVLGLMLTTDSPRYLLISAVCGILSIGILSRASRLLITVLWNKSRHWLFSFLRDASLDRREDSAEPQCRSRSATLRICTPGKAESSGVAVLLRTEGADPLVSYEMINVCKDKPASRDVCTETPSPSLCSCQHVRAMQDGATSPCPLMDCSSPEELFIFDKELADGADGAEGESSSTPGLTAFGSELFDKLASIQKAFQETNGELVSYMSSLSELHLRHCTWSTSGKSYQSAADGMLVCQSLSAPGAVINGLVWEDEFGTDSKYCPPSSRSSSKDLYLWESDLHFYSGLCGDAALEMHQIDNTVFRLNTPSSCRHDVAGERSGRLRDSGCEDLGIFGTQSEWDESDLWPAARVNGITCPTCVEDAISSSQISLMGSGSPQYPPDPPDSPDRVPKKRAK